MKKETFQNALTNVSDKYIVEAATTKKRTASAVKIWRGIAIAASALLVASGLLSAMALSSVSRSGMKHSASYSESYYDGYSAAAPQAVPGGGYGYSSSYDNGYVMEEAAEAEGDAYNSSSATADITTDGSSEGMKDHSKIIYTANLSMQTNDFDTCISSYEELVSKYGAYFESKTVFNGNRNYRSADFSIRVPAENYAALLKDLQDVGTVTNCYENADDVSEAYHDIESKLSTAKTKLARLQELLKDAKDVEDIITIEYYISDTEATIEYYQGLLNGYDSRISYSTINVSINEVYKVDPAPAPVSFGQKLSQAFTDGIEGFTEGLQGMLLFFAEGWTWILFIPALLGIIPVAIILIVKAARRKHRR